MRYPIGVTGSKQEYTDKWYSAQDFGNPTSYGYHEGVDVNLKTGGDTDLGQELKAISNGRLIYYHYSSHPTYGFGRHLVYKIDGVWGTRWIHYAHCQYFTASVRDVNEGEVIAKLGKSGTPYAHLHWAIFKVDPTNLPNKLDTIAKTLQQLNDWWEDPIAFVDKWMQPAPTPEPVISDPKTKIKLVDPYGVQELQAINSMMSAKDTRIKELEGKISNAKSALA